MLLSTFDPERKEIGVYVLEFYTNQFTESTSMEEINALHARIESNLKKIPQRNRRRHFDKRNALIWKLV